LGNWYKKKTTGQRWKEHILPALSGIISTSGMLSALHTLTKIHSKKTSAIAFFPSFSLNIIANIISGILAKKYYDDNLDDRLIEPVRHTDPPQKIWMHRDGAIGIVSTKTKDNEKGRIVLGVNDQEDGEADDWRHYDTFKDPEKMKDFAHLYKLKLKSERDKRMLREEIELKNREAEKHIKLGKGSNIIIKNNNIELRVGGEGDDDADANIKIVKDGVAIKSGQSEVHLRKDGQTSVFANEITLVSEGTIDLVSKEKKPLNIKTDTFKMAGPNFISKYFKVG